MKKKTLLEILYAKHFRKTLTYIRRYEAYMRNNISYEELYQMMEYDYKVFLETKFKKEMVDLTSENAIFKLHELDNVSTNIKSIDDAVCKFKALSLAKRNLDEQ